MTVNDQQLRDLIVRVLRQHPTGQFKSVCGNVAVLMRQATGTTEGHGGYGARQVFGSFDQLSQQDEARVSTILHDFKDERVLRDGLNDGLNDRWPFYHVTAHGSKFLAGETAAPTDAEGYIAKLRAEVPSIDPVIETYIRESVATHRVKCFLSSTITVGCASEKAFLLLIEAYANALPKPQQEKFRKDTDGKMIKRQFDEFSKRLESHLKAQLPGDLKDDLDVTISGVFTLIRNLRNEAGHPSGKSVEEDVSFTNLKLFPMYLKKIYNLIDWLYKHPF